VKQPGDLREDRVGQLVQRVLDGVPSDETRRAYSHALEMFLAFCEREGNPTLSAELVSSYRVSLVGEGKSSSTVGVHLAAIKALTRVSRCTQIADFGWGARDTALKARISKCVCTQIADRVQGAGGHMESVLR
jgi:hypothetical protein